VLHNFVKKTVNSLDISSHSFIYSGNSDSEPDCAPLYSCLCT